MKTQRLAIGLTVINLVLLMFLMAQIRRAGAEGVAPVLRGRALEIVDDRGKVRASITVFPAGPARRADGSLSEANGKIYPETVLLRLINSKGMPNIKIAATELGAGVLAGGESNPTYASLRAEGNSTSLELIDTDKRQLLIKPQSLPSGTKPQ